MSFLDKLERIFGRFALPGIPLVIIAGQVMAWLALQRGLVQEEIFVLLPALARAGQWWRLGTFLFQPPPGGLIVLIFAWWLFYLMASALEGFWGAFRFNVFLLAGYVLTVGVGFLFPFAAVTNVFLGGSVFLAFAYLNPNFELAIFFILPVRIKWLALLTWLLYAAEFIRGSAATRLEVLASVGNFFLFFGHDLWLTARLKGRTMTAEAGRIAHSRSADEPRHRCRVCGKTDKSNPEMDFRYCSRCAGEQCYCSEHIFNHVHVTAEDETRKGP